MTKAQENTSTALPKENEKHYWRIHGSSTVFTMIYIPNENLHDLKERFGKKINASTERMSDRVFHYHTENNFFVTLKDDEDLKICIMVQSSTTVDKGFDIFYDGHSTCNFAPYI
jgi:2-phosphoglycerate kinase